MQEKSLEKARAIAKEMEEKAREKGSEAVFGVEIVASGVNAGNLNVIKEKPDGEIVVYPIQNT